MATADKGLPFIGKMREFLGMALHPTVNKVGHSKAALDVTSRSFYAVNDLNTPLVVLTGSTDNILKATALNAKAGDLIRLVTTANSIKEFEITVHEVVDANTVILAGYLSANLTAGDTFQQLRPISNLVGANGASMATFTAPPIQILKQGVATTVSDNTNPAQVVPIPVKIVSGSGTDINITAGDINIQTSAEGANFDSMRFGDGTGKYAAITANFEIKTKDTDVAAAITTLAGTGLAKEAKQDTQITLATTLNAKDFATSAKQDTAQTSLTALVAKDFATSAKQDTQITRLNLLATEAKQDTQITRLNLLATEAKQDTQITRLNLLATEASLLNSITQETAINTAIGLKADTAATTDNGTFSVIAFIKRGMANWTLLLAKLPNLGQAAKVGSIPVVLASDSDAIKVNETNSTGQISKATLAASGTATVTAPAGATGCFIKNQSASAGDYLYWEIGGTASTLSNDLVPGQGTAFIPCSGAITLLADANGSANYAIQWLIK